MKADRLTYTLAVTNSCPLKCSHCFIGYHGGGSATHATMSIHEVDTILRGIRPLSNRLSLNWTGGEILTVGSQYMDALTSLSCFSDKGVKNGLLSSLPVHLDSRWIEILERFDSLMISLDSYHRERLGKEMKRSLRNMADLNVDQKIAAYTPSPADKEVDLEDFYLMAMDAGAEVFHLGFLYSSNPLPASFYMRAIDKILELEEKFKGPRLGFFNRKSFSANFRASVGFRAYDCFANGGHFSPEGVFTSCYILYRHLKGLGVPWMRTNQFLESKCSITSMNERFIRDFFIKGRPGCLDCEYYPLCMGGCPFFPLFGEGGKDIYCSVYRKIFEILTS